MSTSADATVQSHFTPERPGTRLPLVVEIRVDAACREAIVERLGLLEPVLLPLLADLISDLRIPLAPTVVAERAAAGVLLHPGLCDVLVNDRACRTVEAPPTDLAALTDVVSTTVYANRELLLSDELLELLRGRPDAGAFGTLSAERARRLMTLAWQMGLDVPAALDAARLLEPLGLGDTDFPHVAAAVLGTLLGDEIIVELERGLYDRVLGSDGAVGTVGEMLTLMRQGLFYDLGVQVRPIRLEVGESLAADRFRVRISRLRGPPRHGLASGEKLVNASVAYLDYLAITAVPAVHPVSGAEMAIVDDHVVLPQLGFTEWDAAGHMVLFLAEELRRRVGEYFGVIQTGAALRQLDAAFPMLIFNVLERYRIATVSAVLVDLLAERHSIRNLRAILESLLEADPGLSEEELAEHVRSALRRQIVYQFTGGQPTVDGWHLSPEDAARLARVPLEPLSRAERAALWTALVDVVRTEPAPLVVTAPAIRRIFRDVTAREFPLLRVGSERDVDDGRTVLIRSHELRIAPRTPPGS